MTTLVRTLNFHGIGTPGPEIDARERRYWISADKFRAIIRDLIRPAPNGTIRITFDDGNRSDLDIAAPVLKENGLTATFFVLTGRLNQDAYLGPDDLETLTRMGHRVGSHGQDHVDWARSTSNDLQRETRGSRETLEEVLKTPVTEAAIPFGSYNRSVLTALRKAGYTAAWTSDGGEMDACAFLRPRLSVRSDMTMHDIESALFDPIPLARRLRRHLAMARKRLL